MRVRVRENAFEMLQCEVFLSMSRGSFFTGWAVRTQVGDKNIGGKTEQAR